MFEIKEREKVVERALLIGMHLPGEDKGEAADLLVELEDLVATLGVPVVDRMLVPHREIHSKLYLGTGKAEEVCQRARDLACDVLIFDNELTPAQQRNWEKLSKITVIDRQEIILDIFGKRARTREARIQVDLARMEYSLPRLTRAWSHLGQQGGGIGSKGEGESQLEQDKRKIRGQIDRLKKELVDVRRTRATQRKDRQRTPVPNAAIVGYTNAGKSSLLRSLTGAEVLVEDKLFATLDTTTRKIALPNRQPLLLTDTVGFVRKLPHQLVEAFNATLEEAAFADFLVHVVDASNPRADQFFETTMHVLGNLHATDKPTVVVLNKMDKVEDPSTRLLLKHHFPDGIFVSVHTGEGMNELVERLAGLVGKETAHMHLRLPPSRSDLLARLHREGYVETLEYDGGDALVRAMLPARFAPAYETFLIAPE